MRVRAVRLSICVHDVTASIGKQYKWNGAFFCRPGCACRQGRRGGLLTTSYRSCDSPSSARRRIDPCLTAGRRVTLVFVCVCFSCVLFSARALSKKGGGPPPYTRLPRKKGEFFYFQFFFNFFSFFFFRQKSQIERQKEVSPRLRSRSQWMHLACPISHAKAGTGTIN